MAKIDFVMGRHWEADVFELETVSERMQVAVRTSRVLERRWEALVLESEKVAERT